MRNQRIASQLSAPAGVPHEIRDRTDLCLSGALFLTLLAAYHRTLAPGLLMGDSAELQVLALTPGLSHPTGAPLFLLAARLFAFIPVADPLGRLNLMSAVLGALAPAILYLACRRLTQLRLAAIVGPLLLGISQLYWWEAVMFELYTAAALVLASILACLFLWRQDGRLSWLFIAGMLGGSGPAVHGMIVMAAPAVLLYMAMTTRRRADWTAATAGAVTGVILALGSYLLMDALDPPSGYFNVIGRPSTSVWGLGPGAFDSWSERLSFMTSATHFRKYMLVIPDGGLYVTAAHYADVTRAVFALPALALMVLGLGDLAWRRRSEALLIVVALLTMLAFVLTYQIDEIHAFYIPTYLFLAMLASAGAGLVAETSGWITAKLVSAVRNGVAPSRVVRLVKGFAVPGLILAAASAPFSDEILASLASGRITFLDGTPYDEYPYPVRDPERPRQVAAAIVDRLPQDAMLFTDWPYLYPCIYVARLERHRRDLMFHMCVPDPEERLPTSCLDYIQTSARNHPIYFTWEPAELQRWFAVRQVSGEPKLYRLERWAGQ